MEYFNLNSTEIITRSNVTDLLKFARGLNEGRLLSAIDSKELAESFSYFNDIFELPSKEVAEKVSQGRHPQAKQAFVRMTSFMAAKLRENNPDKFNDYYRKGAIALFADYINRYRKKPNLSEELKFSKTFEKQIERWNTDWAKTWNDYTRKLQITETLDLEKTGKLLQNSFNQKSVYPDFESNFVSLNRIYNDRGDIKKALTAGQIAVDLYPGSSEANVALGITYILQGNKAKALDLFRRANEIEPRGGVSADDLNRIAYVLSGKGQVESGLRLLEISVEIYPEEANLYDSIGEFYNSLGNKEKAIEFYTKALEINPKYPNAANAKELINKLKEQ